ncbi:hypothetical protein V8E54_008796 [Elaphomyces granulatus]
MACNNRRGKTAESRLQAPGMEEAADPSVKDIFRYKIPASFIPVRGAPIMSPMRLPSHANWASHRSAVTIQLGLEESQCPEDMTCQITILTVNVNSTAISPRMSPRVTNFIIETSYVHIPV